MSGLPLSSCDRQVIRPEEDSQDWLSHQPGLSVVPPCPPYFSADSAGVTGAIFGSADYCQL
jgi:hypothetical protein